MVSTSLYLIVLVAVRALHVGIGSNLFHEWPLLIGVILGTQFIRLDQYLCQKFQIGNEHLLTQNILFAGGWIAAALFGITSTQSWLGKGFALGIGLQLLMAMRKSFHFFQLSQNEQKWAKRIFTVAFAILTFFV